MTPAAKLRIGLATLSIAAFVFYFNACSNTSSNGSAPGPSDLTIRFTGGPSNGGVSAATLTFVFSVVSGAPIYACTLDSVTLSNCDPAGVMLSGLTAGTHTFTVQATDTNGPGPMASVSWTVDTTGPSLSITVPMNGTNVSTTFSFQFTSDDSSANHSCELDGAAFACTANSINTLSSIPSGPHIIQVTGVDSLGNSSIVSVSFNVL